MERERRVRREKEEWRERKKSEERERRVRREKEDRD